MEPHGARLTADCFQTLCKAKLTGWHVIGITLPKLFLWSEPFLSILGLWHHRYWWTKKRFVLFIKYICSLLSGLRCSTVCYSGFFLFGSCLDLQYLSALCPMLLWHLVSLQGINKALSTLSHLVYLCTADNTGHTLMDLGKKRWAQCIFFPCFWKAFYQSEGWDDPITSA